MMREMAHQCFAEVFTEIFANRLSIIEARRATRERLKLLGYHKEPWESDFSNLANADMQTQVYGLALSAARNSRSIQRHWAAVRAFPGLSLRQLCLGTTLYDWPERWLAAWLALPESEKCGVSLDPPVALLGHRIWVDVNDFGFSHPPFDKDGKMGVLSVGRTEVLSLGIDLSCQVHNAFAQPDVICGEALGRELLFRLLDSYLQLSD